MIDVTGLTGGALIVNVDQIVTIEQTPDTVICLVNGDKLIVRETPEELVARAVAFRKRIGVCGHESPPAPSGETRHGG